MKETSKFSQWWYYKIVPLLHKLGKHNWVIEAKLPKTIDGKIEYGSIYCTECQEEKL